MANIWDFQGAARIRVTCIDGETLEGRVLAVEDAEENEDDTEDSLVLETADGRCIGLFPSEIRKIERY